MRPIARQTCHVNGWNPKLCLRCRSPSATRDQRWRSPVSLTYLPSSRTGDGIIVDWKTNRKRTAPATLRQRLQSQIYPYLLVEAGQNMPWGPLLPSQVEMRYWFTAAPDEPTRLPYDAAQHAANHQLLQRIIGQILASRDIEDFPLVPDTDANRARLCAYCAYRSRCDRGIVPGNLDDLADLDDLIHDPTGDLEFSLEDIPELAF